MRLSCNREILKEELVFGYFFFLARLTIAKKQPEKYKKNKAEFDFI